MQVPCWICVSLHFTPSPLTAPHPLHMFQFISLQVMFQTMNIFQPSHSKKNTTLPLQCSQPVPSSLRETFQGAFPSGAQSWSPNNQPGIPPAPPGLSPPSDGLALAQASLLSFGTNRASTASLTPHLNSVPSAKYPLFFSWWIISISSSSSSCCSSSGKHEAYRTPGCYANSLKRKCWPCFFYNIKRIESRWRYPIT